MTLLLPPSRIIEQGDRILRPSFKSPGPGPRSFIGKAGLEAKQLREEGIQVRLGEKTLKELLEISVPVTNPDGTPVLDSSGNPVMTKKNINIGDLSKTFEQKIETLNTIIATGQAGTRAGLERVLLIIASSEKLWLMSNVKFQQIKPIIMSFVLDDDPTRTGVNDLVDGQFVDGVTWNRDQQDNGQLIAIWLVNKHGQIAGLTAENPVFGVTGRAIKLRTVVANLRTGQVLDLITRQMFETLEDAQDFAGTPPDDRSAPRVVGETPRGRPRPTSMSIPELTPDVRRLLTEEKTPLPDFDDGTLLSMLLGLPRETIIRNIDRFSTANQNRIIEIGEAIESTGTPTRALEAPLESGLTLEEILPTGFVSVPETIAAEPPEDPFFDPLPDL